MISGFFIERPIFAWVLAIVVMLSGALAIKRLPVEQYPNIASPTVNISAIYPGADAKTVENSVTQVIEQKLTGIDHLRYFSSTSADGTATISLTFEPHSNPDIAQVQTQNKIQSAMQQLPLEVQQQGVIATKSNSSFLLVAGFYSADGNVNQMELGDLLASKIRDNIARIDGVGDVTVFGQPHAMRIWLDPDKLLSYGLTTLDVRNAIQAQNTDVAAGQLGGLPAVPGQQLNATLTAQSKLKTVTDFEQIILRVNTDSSQIRLKDVARVELGSENYARIVRYKQLPAAGIAVSLASGANALDTANAVKAQISALADSLPANVKVIYPYDTTPFIKLSIKNVVQTLFEAMLLVFLVMFLFLQNFRATLIPGIAIPVVLLGTFAILSAFGFTINVLTMFAMVLAIGLLVDDAIVVVENVERIMHEEGLSAKEATKKSMQQITGALIGIAIVLSAVFVPMAFFSGSAGAIYRQFSVTIVSAMALSVLVALILSPSLCATFLKPKKPLNDNDTKNINSHFGCKSIYGLLTALLSRLEAFTLLKKFSFAAKYCRHLCNHRHAHLLHNCFTKFNQLFTYCRSQYLHGSSRIINRAKRFLIIYAALLLGLAYLFLRIPTAFLPNEDQGIMFLLVNTPAGASAERTLESVKKIEAYILEKEQANVEHLFTVVGFSFSGVAQNSGLGFIGLKDWQHRTTAAQSVFAISNRTMGALMQLKDAMAFAIFPPPIRELGNASGFDVQLIDHAGLGHEALMQARNQLLGMAAQNPKLMAVRPNGLEDVPQYKLKIDHEKASAMGLSLADVNQTLQASWGSSYVNDFLDNDKIKRVYLQADAPYRMLPEDVNKWYVRNNHGEMVAFSAFSTGSWSYGSPRLERFNGVPSVNIQGAAAPGISTGEAMQEMSRMATNLPDGFNLAWNGLSYEERLTGSQAPGLYALSILIVFLSLAALYESWSIPFAVLLSIPLGILGAVLITWLKHLSNDVYFQITLLTTVGLVAKNAILIVEFAKHLSTQGHSAVDAALLAAKLRFRPIVMTSMAFILGVTPLALAHGAGSASQNAIGLGVIGGMIAATTIVILFVPMFYIKITDALMRNVTK